jgi:organic radical activating enzyme
MPGLLDSIRTLFSSVEPLPSGTYHYIAPPDDPRNYRLHLRIEQDGTAILIVNAATILHLNETAAEYAYHLVNCTPQEQVIQSISSRYRVSRTQAQRDYQDFLERIDTIITIPDLDPVMFLDFDRQQPYEGVISAPYRLDCALTYQLPDDVDVEFAPQKRVSHELTTDEWQRVIDKAWEIGIPHIVFTGGEPTLRSDLITLIEKAEANGQVTGLATDGFKLNDQKYLDALLQTGLDHLLFIYNAKYDFTWETLRKVIEADIYVVVHLTITPENVADIPDFLQKLKSNDVYALSLSTTTDTLNETLESIRELAAEQKFDLVWDIPVPYSSHNPVAVELNVAEIEVPEGAGRAWLYVEPDGDVLPAQGINQVLGNVLTDSWDTIWAHPED